MTVLNPTKRVQRLFEITHLNNVFQILDNEADAIAKTGNASA
jgi:anti-anti-sigma regulatory factor